LRRPRPLALFDVRRAPCAGLFFSSRPISMAGIRAGAA
jgi:hypothetical protein